MISKPKNFLYPSPAWTLRQGVANQLLCSAGADQIFAIEEIAAEIIDEILHCWKVGRFDQIKLSKPALQITEQLLSAGIVKPRLDGLTKKIKVALLGDATYTGRLKPMMRNLRVSFSAVDQSELIVIVRTNQTYAALLSELDYSHLNVPHLLVDLGYHHTVSVGPLVFPGQTACLACLQGRIANRWGDEPLPLSPAITDNADLAFQLIKVELSKLISDNDYSLVQKTVAYDFQDRRIQINTLYKVPLCPICKNNALDMSGMVALPWS